MTAEEKEIRKQFPLIDNCAEAYLDNAATTQKPQCVLDAVSDYYTKDNANPLRGLYDLSVRATDDYENARKKVADFIGAGSTREVIFTRNASESLNLVAYSYARNFLHEGDEIIVAVSEHHSNMLPWQQAAKAVGAEVKYLFCEPDGSLTVSGLTSLINKNTKLVCIAQVSNVFGRVNPIREFADLAHSVGAKFVCDGAQSVPHMKVDVKELGVDFLAFSGHKMYAPMGIGVLWAKEKLLEKMPPFMTGGEMIEYVTLCGATYAELPHKFEAGTVNAGAAVGLGAAIDFINSVGMENIEKRELELTRYALEQMQAIPHVNIIGGKTAEEHHGIITFRIDDVHPHDIAAIFNEDGIDARAGHHCTQPLHKYLRLMSTMRASLAYYNTYEEIDRLAASIKTVRERMGYGE